MRLDYKQDDGFYTILSSESKQMTTLVMIHDMEEGLDEISEIKQRLKEDGSGSTQISMEEKKLGKIPYVQAQYKDKKY